MVTRRTLLAANFGTWEGWGTSLAWWATVFGDRDDFANLFFTTNTVSYHGASLPGLGTNIARYNLGACSWHSVNGETMVASPNIPRFKQIEGSGRTGPSPTRTSGAGRWTPGSGRR